LKECAESNQMMNNARTSPSDRNVSAYSHWHREHDQWESEISRWQADHQYALVELERIAERVVNHGEALRRHATDLNGHKQALTAMEEFVSGAAAPQRTLDGMVTSHAKYQEVHERIRRHHDNVMALLRTLVGALRAPL